MAHSLTSEYRTVLFSTTGPLLSTEMKWYLQMRLLLNKGNEKNQSYMKISEQFPRFADGLQKENGRVRGLTDS